MEKSTLSLKKEEVIEEPKLVSVTLNLSPSAGGAIVHNGVTYISRVAYQVPQGVANDLGEIERRGWAHEASLHESENKNRRNNRAFI